MQGFIGKTAKEKSNFNHRIIFYQNARTGFSEILKKLSEKYRDLTLLLPGFIGYSPNEGSGIYDPVLQNNIKHEFYSIDENVNVITSEYEKIISTATGKIVVLLVHYYGYLDKNIDELVKIAKKYDAIIIEDCAHALFTDYIDGSCGDYGDFSIYSLHKMLPYQDGGMVKINTKEFILEDTEYYYNLLEYNLKQISDIRKRNAKIIERELCGVEGIKILRSTKLYCNQTPQTFPIIIEKKDKNYLYHTINEAGYGVVSLYHTMIDSLKNEEIPNEIAHKILNLPIHQDAHEDDLVMMCDLIKKLVKDGE